MHMCNTRISTKLTGHYSPAIIHDNLVYLSGQISIDYQKSETKPHGRIEEQTRQVLNNIAKILEKCGSSKLQIIKTTVFIPDITYWPVINDIYAEFFGDYKPARTMVPTNTLHFDALIEIEAIAYI